MPARPWMLILLCLFPLSLFAEPRHIKIFHEPGQFGGWPANHGLWIWGNELLVGFSTGTYKDLGDRHHIDRQKPEYHRLARSLDGGETWKLEEPVNYLAPEGKFLHGTPPPEINRPAWKECPGGIRFQDPNFAMALRMIDVDVGPSKFAFSYDRGKTWEGPFRLPNLETGGVAARTEYLVNSASNCFLFLTAAKANKDEGRPLCYETTDGGQTWNLRSWIGPEPKGFSIMPSAVRLNANEILVALRYQEPAKKSIELYHSTDNARTWKSLGEPVGDTGVGNPPAMIRLQDGRICLTYGVRKAPFRMCAKLSPDNGKTWGPEIVLRQDGGSRDVGYPRTVQRPDGKVVTIYYFNDPKTGPERYIAATIWEP